jgi:hypothetical protein
MPVFMRFRKGLWIRAGKKTVFTKQFAAFGLESMGCILSERHNPGLLSRTPARAGFKIGICHCHLTGLEPALSFRLQQGLFLVSLQSPQACRLFS